MIAKGNCFFFLYSSKKIVTYRNEALMGKNYPEQNLSIIQHQNVVWSDTIATQESTSKLYSCVLYTSLQS